MKSGYEPGQQSGVNKFHLWGELIAIIHPDGRLEREQVHDGQVLLLRRSDNLYWCGRAYKNEFIFLLGSATPVEIEKAFDYLRAAWCMEEEHSDSDFVEQWELDF